MEPTNITQSSPKFMSNVVFIYLISSLITLCLLCLVYVPFVIFITYPFYHGEMISIPISMDHLYCFTVVLRMQQVSCTLIVNDRFEFPLHFLNFKECDHIRQHQNKIALLWFPLSYIIYKAILKSKCCQYKYRRMSDCLSQIDISVYFLYNCIKPGHDYHPLEVCTILYWL